MEEGKGEGRARWGLGAARLRPPWYALPAITCLPFLAHHDANCRACLRPPPVAPQALGLNTTQFDRHVILETNNATERVFPEVPDVEAPGFWDRMDRMVGYNTKVRRALGPPGGRGGVSGTAAGMTASLRCPPCRRCTPSAELRRLPPSPCPAPNPPALASQLVEIDNSDAPEWLKKVQKLPYTERILAECLQVRLGGRGVVARVAAVPTGCYRCLPRLVPAHCALLRGGPLQFSLSALAAHAHPGASCAHRRPPTAPLALPAQLFFMPTKRTGSLDIEGSKGYVY